MSQVCGFCGLSNLEVQFLVAGPGINIGSCCIPQLSEVKSIQKADRKLERPALPKTGELFARCSFCGEVRRGDEKVVGSERIEGVDLDPVICHSCIELCESILAEQEGVSA